MASKMFSYLFKLSNNNCTCTFKQNTSSKGLALSKHKFIDETLCYEAKKLCSSNTSEGTAASYFEYLL